MALKNFKPTSPSQRQLVLVDRSHLWKGKPVKSLTEGLNKSGGRNNTGRVSIWHRGGGHKRSYRLVDFKRTKRGMPATVERIEYDPNRTAFIALIKYEDGDLAYILAPQRLAPGDTVIADDKADVKPGSGSTPGSDGGAGGGSGTVEISESDLLKQVSSGDLKEAEAALESAFKADKEERLAIS